MQTTLDMQAQELNKQDNLMASIFSFIDRAAFNEMRLVSTQFYLVLQKSKEMQMSREVKTDDFYMGIRTILLAKDFNKKVSNS